MAPTNQPREGLAQANGSRPTTPPCRQYQQNPSPRYRPTTWLPLNQWRLDEHVPINGVRDRWQQLLLAGRPEEAREMALHRLHVAEVVSWWRSWPAISLAYPMRRPAA